MDDCLFCKIAKKEIPANVVYEDDEVICFHDIEPLTPVHVLVVPKAHYQNICDNVPAHTLEAIAHGIQEVSKITGVDKTGFRAITNTGADSGQSVPHLHVHVLGGKKLNPTAGE